MQESAPNKNQRRGVLEAGAVAVALLGALDHGPAQALEIEPSASWSVGVQKLERAAKEEKNESSAVYMRFNNGTGAWVAITAGTEAAVTTSTQPESDYLVKNIGQRSIDKRCEIHTHPQYTSTDTEGKKYVLQYMPPSKEDILGEAEMRPHLDEVYRSNRLPVKKFTSAVADQNGIWYYQGKTNTHVTPEQLKAWQTGAYGFIQRSYNRDFNFQAEYAELQKVYKTNLSADIRYVPYEQIKNEPACAGVEYVARPANASKKAAPKK